MIWLTRISFLETARDLGDGDLISTARWAYDRLHLAAFSEMPDGSESGFHPCDAMWEGHDLALAAYAQALCVESGYRGAPSPVSRDILKVAEMIQGAGDRFKMPDWIGDTDILRSHRSNMARRWPTAYGEKWGKIDKNWPYLWPAFVEGGWVLRLSKHDKDLMYSGARSLPSAILERIENV